MKQKLTTLALVLLAGISAWAHDFSVGGIYYVITSSTDLTVSVSYRGDRFDSYSNEYGSTVVIPSIVTYMGKTYTVTSIDGYAFAGCKDLISVVIPSSVSEIGASAFRSCSGLISVTIPSGVASIGERSFSYCTSLSSVTIPNSVTFIGEKAFLDCTSLKTVNFNAEKCTYVGFGIFEACTSLVELNIGDNVQTIPDNAFFGCSGLVSVNIPNNVTFIGEKAFLGCTSLKTVNIPNNVTSIGSYAFSGCSSLTSVTIPNSVARIGKSAFLNCSELKTVNFNAEECTYMGNDKDPVFGGCTSLTEFNIGVQNIPDYALYGCSGLTSIVIPSSVTSIGDKAFFNVTKAFFLTNTKPSIGSSAFSNCKVYYTANNDSYGISGTHKVYSLLSSMFEVDGVKYIPTSMSQRTCDMVDVDYTAATVNSAIGPTVKYTRSNGRQEDYKVNNVNMYAGYGCKAFSDLSLKNEGEIETYAFYNSSATTIDVDNTVTAIGYYAFSGCSSTTKITVSNNGSIKDNAFEGCMTTSNGEISIFNKGNINSSAFKGCTKATIINIKNEGSIGDDAFYGCSDAKEIKIGDAVTSIGNRSFYNCSSVGKIKLSKNIASIGSGCFYNCLNMTSVELNDKITTINSLAFSGCNRLASLSIPVCVASIGSSAFSGCNALTSLTIPSGVTSIASGAFDGCTSINNLTLEDCETAISIACSFASVKNFYMGRNITYSMGDSSPFSGNNYLEKVTTSFNVTSLSDYAFINCKNLKEVYISDGVKTIGRYAFFGDEALAKFEMGMSVEDIGEEAFYDCVTLLDFRSHSIIPATAGTEALVDIDKNVCTLHVPKGTKDAYKSADQWKDFLIEDDLQPRYKVIATVDPESIGMGIVKGSNGYINNETATIEAVPDKWHTFVKWSDGNTDNPRTITVTEALDFTAKFAYKYYIKTQPTVNNITVALNKEAPGAQYNWYVSDGKAKVITNALQSSSSYKWTLNNGVWTSGNKGIKNSSSKMSVSITAKAGDKLTFDYTVSGKSSYDYLGVYLDGSRIVRYTGSESGNYEYTFTSSKTTTLAFYYTKTTNSSTTGISDKATISNVVIGDGTIPTLLEHEESNRVSNTSLEADMYYYCEIVMPDGTLLTSNQVQFEGEGDSTQSQPIVEEAVGGTTQLVSYDSETGTAIIKITPDEGYREQYIFVDGIVLYDSAYEAGQTISVTKLGDDMYSLTNIGKTSVIITTFYSKATSIDVVKTSTSVEGIYDILGRKLTAPRRGINIINGKKVIVR